MKGSFKITVILIFFGLLIQVQKSSAQVSDANIWTRFAVKYDLDKNTRLALEEEFRFYNNASMLEQNHTEIGLSREILKRFELGAYYRFIYETDEDRFYSVGHRAWLQLEFLMFDRDVQVFARNRTLATVKNVKSSENGHIPEWYNRYKLGIKYKPNKAKWIPEGGIEFWHPLNPAGKSHIDKMRASIELEYRFSDHWRGKIFYALQQELQVANPEIDHIWGIAVTYLIN